MKQRIVCFILLGILMYGSAMSQSVDSTSPTAPRHQSPFLLTPAAFSQGDTLHVVYRPQFAGHNDSAGVKASVYVFRNFAWEGFDIPIDKTEKGWETTYILPPGTAMVDFHFLLGDSVDKGSRIPYCGLVHAKPKVMALGAYTEWGLMRYKDKTGGMLDVVPVSSKIEPKVAMMWVGQEWEKPLVLRNMFPGIARAVKANFKDAADSTLRKMAKALLEQPDLTERQCIYIQKMYSDVLHDKRTADSLEKIVIVRFPGGLGERVARLGEIQREKDSAKRIALRTRFFSDFPLDKYPLDEYLDPEVSDPILASHVFMEEAFQTFNRQDWPKLHQIMEESPFQYLGYFYGHFCMFPFRSDAPSLTSKEACLVSGWLIDEILRRMKDPDPTVSGRGYIAPQEWIRRNMREDAEFFGFHMKLLIDNGQAEKSYAFGKQLEPTIGIRNITFNDNYTRAMQQLKKEHEAIPFITQAVFAGMETPAMVNILESDYRKTHDAAANFFGYYQGLRSRETIEKEHARFEKSLINVSAPLLQLPDMDGRIIDLTKLKGKIVVLDFWATWCYPCKAAMAGMQMAVNKYKQDTNVVFFFVSTMEEKPDYKGSIISFLKEKKYDFHVLCDQPDSTTHKNDQVFHRWAGSFEMAGIPQKLIVDQNGVVRWKAGGFSGNVIQVADEVSYIIQYLKDQAK